MIAEVKIPSAGESVTEAAIGNWLVEDGTYVEKDQEIAEVETDKATLPLIASDSGTLHIVAKPGMKVRIGDVACTIDTSAKPAATAKKAPKKEKSVPVPSVAAATSEEHVQQPVPEPPHAVSEKQPEEQISKKKEDTAVKVTPLARTIMEQNDLDIEAIITGLKKITRQEVEQVLQTKDQLKNPDQENRPAGDSVSGVKRTPMSPLRRKLSKRLVSVKNETAMLTTFNEVDMSNLMDLRKKYQAKFQEKFGQKLGLMSFFIMASNRALLQFPRVNSYIDGDDIVTPDFVDIAIAVQTDKGLMVPVIRNTGAMNLDSIEKSINMLAEKAKASKLTIDEMTGGTFTITNGGIFGSMLSTPILNPPQSAILGMHNIVERPVAVNGRVEIRPIMYVALSYDHRLIDGRESVSFLYKVKELIEHPVYMLINQQDPEKALLGL